MQIVMLQGSLTDVKRKWGVNDVQGQDCHYNYRSVECTADTSAPITGIRVIRKTRGLLRNDDQTRHTGCQPDSYIHSKSICSDSA